MGAPPGPTLPTASDRFSKGDWGQAPHSSAPWGVHGWVPKGPGVGGLGEEKVVRSAWRVRGARPASPPTKAECRLLTEPCLPASLQPPVLTHTQGPLECPPSSYPQPTGLSSRPGAHRQLLYVFSAQVCLEF